MVTINDVRSRGYDLLVDGRLNQGDFETIEASANQFIDECCGMIWGLIAKHRGYVWTNEFKQDMMRDDLNDMALVCQQVLKEAMLDQVIFIYENGDASASATIDTTKRTISPRAIGKLYSVGIIWV